MQKSNNLFLGWLEFLTFMLTVMYLKMVSDEMLHLPHSSASTVLCSSPDLKFIALHYHWDEIFSKYKKGENRPGEM